MLYSYTLETPAENLCPITAQVQGAVADSGITDGICVVYCPHTTAGITINEKRRPRCGNRSAAGISEGVSGQTGISPYGGQFLCSRPCFGNGQQRDHSRAERQTGSGHMAGCVLLRIRRSTPPDVLCQRHCRIERGRYHGNGKNQTIAAMGGSVGSYRVFWRSRRFYRKRDSRLPQSGRAVSSAV